ncbi:hypothetical protein FHU34_112507 [Micromonospora taraxaci]|uniref:Uncharacterized protein n=1 Tax=Micromonospora taraxaci TaxID=1316803 RepID=A0A561VZX2_9ACTN|nr:hypothetical protein FHU34_112507 [Micromonospora taraxaci]
MTTMPRPANDVFEGVQVGTFEDEIPEQAH